MTEGNRSGKMWKMGQPALVSGALLCLVLVLPLFIMPHTVEASVPLQMVSPGHDDGLPKHSHQYQWPFTGDVIVMTEIDVRRPVIGETGELRRSLRGLVVCEVGSFRAPYADLLPVPDCCPALCTNAPPGFVPRL